MSKWKEIGFVLLILGFFWIALHDSCGECQAKWAMMKEAWKGD